MPWLRPQLEEIAKLVDAATAAADKSTQAAGPALLRGLDLTRALIGKVEGSRLSPVEKADLLAGLRTKQQQFEEAANLACAVELVVTPGTPDGRPMAEAFKTSDGNVLAAVITAGKSFLLRAVLHNGSNLVMEVKDFQLDVPPGWKAQPFMDKVPASIASGDGAAVTFRVFPPADAQPTEQYFHREDPEVDTIYQLDDAKYATLPLPPPPVIAHVVYGLNGEEGLIQAVARTPMHNTKGDVWSMPLSVVPPFSVTSSPTTRIILAGASPSADLGVVVRSTLDRASGTVQPEVPSGWQVEPSSAVVNFGQPGERASQFKELPDGAREARYRVQAAMSANGRQYRDGYSLVARPDIGGFFYYQPASQRASVVEVKVPSELRVGYIMGAGDDIPAVLEQLGLNVTLLNTEDLERGDLSRFGTIVLGIRAYDTRDDLKKNNRRLLDYIKNGGTLVVQYNTGPEEFNTAKVLPYPAQLSHVRVTKEQAPIAVLDPHNQVFHYPNEITQRDFDGWVQERGLYFMDTWDPQYTPLLSSNDPGEEPRKGGLLLAQYGKGYYIYNAYAFFRQLPFGVPGAIRLYVNILSIGHEPK